MLELKIRPAVGLVLAAAVVGCGGSGSSGSTTPQSARMATSLAKTPEGLAQAQAGGRALGCFSTDIQYGMVRVRCGNRGTAMFSINSPRYDTAYVSCVGGASGASQEVCAKLAEDIIAAGAVHEISAPVVVPAFDPSGKNDGRGRVTAPTQMRVPEWGAEVELPVSDIDWVTGKPGWMLTVKSDDALWMFVVMADSLDNVMAGQRKMLQQDGATSGELQASSLRLFDTDTKQFEITMSKSRGAGLVASMGQCTVSVLMITRNQEPAHVQSMLERGASMIRSAPEGARCK